MRGLIRHILHESTALSNIVNVIKDEGIFAAADLVGGLNNLKKMVKPFPELTDMIDSLKGKMNLVYHSRKQYLEFPMRFEIVGIGKNTFNTNSWPIVNLIYDDSKLSESEKKMFEQFICDTINDLNIMVVEITPEVRDMYKDGYYVAIDYVNGRSYEDLYHDLKYDDNDMRNLHREYYTKSYMNESKIIQENEEDPTQKILNFLSRRYKVEDIDLGWEGNPIKFKTINFDVDDEKYGFTTFENKRKQIRKIVDMLIIHNVIEPIDPYERQLDPYTQKVIRSIKLFIDKVMSDEGSN
jgi:hypothetical protein